MKIRSLAAIAMAAALVACGGGPQASGSFRTHASYDRLFGGAMAATTAVGYHITGVNRADGVITAEQNVIMGHGSATSMSAVISNDESARILRVTFVAPPGTFAIGDFNQNVAGYIAAVEASMPDLPRSASRTAR